MIVIEKKHVLCSILFFLLPAAVYISCKGDESVHSSGDSVAEAQRVTLENVQGKTLYAVLINPSSSAIDAEHMRMIESVSGIEVQDSTAGALTSLAERKSVEENLSCVSYRSVKNTVVSGERTAAAEEIVQPEKLTDPAVNETVLKIYVDNDLSMQTYRKKSATLRAKGKYCYVWVVDDYFTEEEVTSENVTDKADSATALKLAEKFDALYPVERYLFGEESETVFYNNSPYSTMDEWSATGSKVNIVLYDIGCDRYSFYQKGVMGYFYDKDYFIPVKNGDLRYSNQGKYFYVDSYYAVKYADTIISTLAHEFQHMIAFGVEKTQEEAVWYKEMLALLAEDSLFDFLSIPEEAGPRYRLSSFNAHYIYSGVEYNTDEGSLSYSTLYAFGAWCARNFGGAEFIKTLALCPYSNEAAVVHAVNKYKGTDYSFGEILELYARSLINGEETLTLNRAGDETIIFEDETTEYTYPLPAIDISSEEFHWSSSVLDSTYLKNETDENSLYINPALFDIGFMPECIRPNGFILYRLGTSSSENVEVVISSGCAEEEVYLYAF